MLSIVYLENKAWLYEGFIARIFQHEYDHLNGLDFIGQLNTTEDIISEPEYQKLVTT